MLEVGDIVGGKLRIERILGEGGMGTVAVATHLHLDQPVAIKVVRDPMLGNEEVVERFLREARASARLRSDHVCKVSDVGQLEDGTPYLVMELLDGSDLQRVIAASPLHTATAADYVLQACVAVAEAHALGIVHRDLKPANLFLTRRFDGTPLIKVLDFGIATAPTVSDIRITKTATVLGSPGYMSPEQLRSMHDVDGRSDVWALGVILYELVTGHLPFRAQTVTEMTVKIVMDPPEPLAIDAPAFVAVVQRCLEKDVTRRYQSVTELAADLAPLAGEAGPRTAALVASIQHAPPRGARAGTAPIVPGVISPAQSASFASARSIPTAPTPPMGNALANAPTQFLTPSPPDTVGRATTLQAATGSVPAPAAPRRRRSFVLGLVVGATAIVAGAGAALYFSNDKLEIVASAPAPGSARSPALAPPPVPAPPSVANTPPAPPAPPAAEAPPVPPSPAPHNPSVKMAPAPAAVDDDGNAAPPAAPVMPASDAQKLGEGRAALTTRKNERALEIAQSLLKVWPSHPAVLKLAISAACRLKRDKLAHELFDRLTARPLAYRRQIKLLRAECGSNGVTL